MVFLQSIPAQTVSWPNDPFQVRRPEGGIGPSLCKIMYTICFMYYSHLFCVAQILLSKPVEWIKGMTNLPERMKTSIYVLFPLDNNSRCTIHTVQNYTHFKSYLLEKLQMVSPWTLCQQKTGMTQCPLILFRFDYMLSLLVALLYLYPARHTKAINSSMKTCLHFHTIYVNFFLETNTLASKH